MTVNARHFCPVEGCHTRLCNEVVTRAISVQSGGYVLKRHSFRCRPTNPGIDAPSPASNRRDYTITALFYSFSARRCSSTVELVHAQSTFTSSVDTPAFLWTTL